MRRARPSTSRAARARRGDGATVRGGVRRVRRRRAASLARLREGRVTVTLRPSARDGRARRRGAGAKRSASATRVEGAATWAVDAAAEAAALVERVSRTLSDELDPIDWATYESRLWANAARAYGRGATLHGLFAQLHGIHRGENTRGGVGETPASPRRFRRGFRTFRSARRRRGARARRRARRRARWIGQPPDGTGSERLEAREGTTKTAGTFSVSSDRVLDWGRDPWRGHSEREGTPTGWSKSASTIDIPTSTGARVAPRRSSRHSLHRSSAFFFYDVSRARHSSS